MLFSVSNVYQDAKHHGAKRSDLNLFVLSFRINLTTILLYSMGLFLVRNTTMVLNVILVKF